MSRSASGNLTTNFYDYIKTMMGAGFMKDMADSSRRNRSLLKGGDSGTYNSFDSKSYTAKPGKVPSFKKASPEVLERIRAQMKIDNNRSTKTKRIVLFTTILSVAGLLTVLLLML
ncbi:hypothetical protein [Marinoscillum sp.]|uniref:hypothetical protein n=1 Tax=Marinoscillum sp. TaxID=2024838 RepID=UPI003BAB9AEC